MDTVFQYEICLLPNLFEPSYLSRSPPVAEIIPRGGEAPLQASWALVKIKAGLGAISFGIISLRHI